MKWNTKQKASAAVLALAGAALCVDRFVLGYGPQSAAAATDAPAIADAAPAAALEAPGPNAARGDSTRVPTLSQRIAALGASTSESAPAADAFRSPASWAALAREPQQPKAANASSAPTQKQAPNFTVSSVFLGSGKFAPAARINGKVVRAGETIRGHTLLRIEPGSPSVVVLKGDAQEIRVPLTIGSNANPSPEDTQAGSAADASH